MFLICIFPLIRPLRFILTFANLPKFEKKYPSDKHLVIILSRTYLFYFQRPARYAQLTILEQTDFDDQRWSREVEGTVDLIINNYRDVIRRLEKK